MDSTRAAHEGSNSSFVQPILRRSLHREDCLHGAQALGFPEQEHGSSSHMLNRSYPPRKEGLIIHIMFPHCQEIRELRKQTILTGHRIQSTQALSLGMLIIWD